MVTTGQLPTRALFMPQSSSPHHSAGPNICGKVGMLFIDFETPNRLRLHANAKLNRSDEALARFPGANLVVDAVVDNVFVNCARYVHKHKRLEPSEYVPVG